MFMLKLISGLLFVLIWMYVLVPLTELINLTDPDYKPFPYKMVFPYDANHGWPYPVTYILTSLAGFGVVTTLFSEDSLFGFFLVYSCGRFRLLHKKIDAIIDTGMENAIGKHSGRGVVRADNAHREYNLLLKEVVQQHSQIILFANALEAFFSPMILINYTISSFLICLTGFQIASSEVTAWKFYACDWQGKSSIRTNNTMDSYPPGKNGKLKTITHYAADVKFLKQLQIAIQRSQKPLCITAYKFSILSLKSFTAILSTSLSYFTLLQTLVEKSE